MVCIPNPTVARGSPRNGRPCPVLPQEAADRAPIPPIIQAEIRTKGRATPSEPVNEGWGLS
jgi:hypothetical protein